ncbi:MAG: glycosyltransferase [Candidatus Latescibacteria bacterium]|nr:glycosyltransferase [Candidatus Latescibacterota bacterium]
MNEFKIAHIDTYSAWRGGQRQVLELIKGLKKKGIENVLICREGSEISTRAGEADIPVSHLALRGEWDIASALKLRAFIKKEKIKIVHVHTAHAHTIALMALWKLIDCKLVVSRRVVFHVHSLFSQKIKYGKSVDKIIAISDAVRRVLIEDGIDPGKIVTIRSGINLDEYTGSETMKNYRDTLGLPRETVLIVNVAALTENKAQSVLLKAAFHVVKKYPDVVFLIAGEGEMRTTIEKDIHNLGLEKSVILLGFIDDIGRLYNSADIFVITSREEGLCSSILDALYFKLPVVATRAGGIPELVQDGVNGYIVPVDDYASIADRLIYLIENKETRKKMGARSTAILDRNTINHTIEKTIDVYHEVLNHNIV